MEDGDGNGKGGRNKKPVPAQWPEAEFIIANPPFSGSNLEKLKLLPPKSSDDAEAGR